MTLRTRRVILYLVERVIYREYHGPLAELAYAADLKSAALTAWGFKSLTGYRSYLTITLNKAITQPWARQFDAIMSLSIVSISVRNAISVLGMHVEARMRL